MRARIIRIAWTLVVLATPVALALALGAPFKWK